MIRTYAIIGLLTALLGCGTWRPLTKRHHPAAVYTPIHDSESCTTQVRPPKHVLCISGGGLYGAYLAGFLNGWTNTGTRPEFDVVTGISTGSLIGLCAFLGPEYDSLAKVTYTTARQQDIYTLQAWYTIPFSASVLSNAPFRKGIESAVTPEVIARVAEAHRQGRRFYVGSTNIETKRLVTWDMGSLACRGTPESVDLFKQVLVASCAIPGAFPPTPIKVCDEEGERIEWHVDGGASAPMFVPPGLISTSNNAAAEGMTVYGFVSGKFFSSKEPIKPNVLSVLKATVPSVIQGHIRSELASISHLATLAGARFLCTALPAEFEIRGNLIELSTADQNRLFLEGYRNGSAGPSWLTQPPTESASIDQPRP